MCAFIETTFKNFYSNEETIENEKEEEECKKVMERKNVGWGKE